MVALKVGTYDENAGAVGIGLARRHARGDAQGTAPSYDQVAPQIRQQMTNELFAAAMQTLRANAKIEIVQAAVPAPAPVAPAAPAAPAK